jgi:hypothetical protein
MNSEIRPSTAGTHRRQSASTTTGDPSQTQTGTVPTSPHSASARFSTWPAAASNLPAEDPARPSWVRVPRLIFERPRHHAVHMDDRYQGFAGRLEPSEEPPDWLESLPTGAAGQSCAFCDNDAVRWVHALDPKLVQYRVYGKGHTLPTFWTLCDRCEQLYRAGDADAVVTVMMTSGRPGLGDPTILTSTCGSRSLCSPAPISAHVRWPPDGRATQPDVYVVTSWRTWPLGNSAPSHLF